jgi:hypothetical protein
MSQAGKISKSIADGKNKTFNKESRKRAKIESACLHMQDPESACIDAKEGGPSFDLDVSRACGPSDGSEGECWFVFEKFVVF